MSSAATRLRAMSDGEGSEAGAATGAMPAGRPQDKLVSPGGDWSRRAFKGPYKALKGPYKALKGLMRPLRVLIRASQGLIRPFKGPARPDPLLRVA